jgi:hypothetical protein
MKQEKVMSLLYEVKKEEDSVDGFGEEEEDIKTAKTLSIEEIEETFEKFMNSFSNLNIHFIKIFVAYNKELKSAERGEYLEEQDEDIFYEYTAPDEQPLVAGGEDDSTDGFEGEELV